jgi:hypothetical protein
MDAANVGYAQAHLTEDVHEQEGIMELDKTQTHVVAHASHASSEEKEKDC